MCQQRYALENERCMLFPTRKVANFCREFIQKRLSQSGSDESPKLVRLLICADDLKKGSKTDSSSPTEVYVDFNIVLFPKDAFRIAKEFWQHTGLGISSRFAERCLSLLLDGSSLILCPTNLPNRYGNKCCPELPDTQPTTLLPSDEESNAQYSYYFEGRYGRNSPFTDPSAAKSVLRSRIAQGLEAQARSLSVSSDDVYLYPCGMAAIWNAHQLLLDVRPPAKSVCFGLVPYSS